MLSQLYSVIGHADSIRIVTPFLDSTALSELSNSFSAPSIILDLPSEGADTPLAAAINAAFNVEARTLSAPRRLHAKAYEFTVNNEHWLALGSANCTQAGLIKSISDGGNSEFLVVIPAELGDEEDMEFEPVSDAKNYPGTGRRWDEDDRNDTNPVVYFSATYNNKELSIVWECDGQLLDPQVMLDNTTYDLEESPAKLILDEKPPQSIVLCGLLSDKEISAKAWVVFSEELDANAANVFINRRRSYLESTDPFQQVQGIDYELLQLIRILLSSSENLERETGISTPQRLNRATVEESIYVFDYSPDHDDIVHHASRMIVGNINTDPLALIRGLLAKINGPIPKEHMSDEASVEDFVFRHTKAKRRTGDILINHLRRIKALSEDDWASKPTEQIKAFLRGTFEIISLLYWKVIRLEQDYTGKFVEELMECLESIIHIENCRNICRDVEVCGPFILTLGAIADSTSDEHERSLLRGYLRQIEGDPHTNITHWANSYQERALLILGTAKEANLEAAIQSRMRPVDHLMGIADKQLLQKQQGKWGLLLELVKAVQDGDSAVSDLRQEAEARFKNHPVWLRSKMYLDAGGIPPILRINRYICKKCFLALPYASIHALEKAEAVVWTNCGSILMFGELIGTHPTK